MAAHTHLVTIEVSGGRNSEGSPEELSRIAISGDGSLDHMIEAFKVSLIASGFSMDTVRMLDSLDV